MASAASIWGLRPLREGLIANANRAVDMFKAEIGATRARIKASSAYMPRAALASKAKLLHKPRR